MNRLFWLLVVLVISLTAVQPTFALDTNPPPCTTSPCVYVNSVRQPTGNEDGTSTSPYNTVEEGKAYAQSLPNGGTVYYWDAATQQWKNQYIPPAISGGMGEDLPNSTRYVILAVVALILITIGWTLLRRSRALRKA